MHNSSMRRKSATLVMVPDYITEVWAQQDNRTANIHCLKRICKEEGGRRLGGDPRGMWMSRWVVEWEFFGWRTGRQWGDRTVGFVGL